MRTSSLLLAGVTFCGVFTLFSSQSAIRGSVQDEFETSRVIAKRSDLLKSQLDIPYATVEGRELCLDLFCRQDVKGARPTVVLVHGGGWMSGNKERFHALAHAFALRGYTSISIEYRLGGEAPYPAAVIDCQSAMQFIVAHAEQLQVDPTQLFAVGGSAGGHLVGLLAAARELPAFQPTDNKDTAKPWKLTAALVMAGPMDLTTGPIAARSRQEPETANTNRWLGASIDEEPARFRQASPLTHFSQDTSPIFFFTGQRDQLVHNAEARALLRKLGIPTNVHVYYEGKHGCWNEHPWFDEMVNDMDLCMRGFAQEDVLDVAWPVSQWERGSLHQSAEALEWTLPEVTASTLEFPRLNNPVKTVVLVDTVEEEIALHPEVDFWQLKLGKDRVGKPAKLRISTVGMPRIARLPVVSTEQEGRIRLAAHHANVHGKLLRYEPQPHKNTVGYWADADDWVDWHFYLDEPGTFEIRIWQGCGSKQGGSKVQAKVGDQSVAFEVVDTGHFQNFVERSIGQLRIDSAGTHRFELRVQNKAANAVMDVRKVELIRVEN